MNDWNKVSHFVKFTTKGITPKYVDSSSIIVLNQKCIRNNQIDYSFAQFTDDSKKIANEKFVQKGDILINSTGTGTAGRCAFVSDVPSGKRLITDSHILILRCSRYEEAQCLSFVLYSFEKTLMSFMTGSSGQSELDKVILLNLKTKMPTDSLIQLNITKVLSSINTKIELNNRINTELEAMAKLIYDYWFVQFDFPDENGKPYKSSGGKMVWSEELKREIPDGWKIGTLAEITSLEYGKPLKMETRSGSGYPVLGSNGIVGYHSEFLIHGPGIVIGRKGSAGEITWVDDHFYPIDTTYFVKDKLGINELVFHYYTLQNANLKQFESSSAVPGLNRETAYSRKTVIPNKIQIEKFNSIVMPMYTKISRNNKESRQLAELRDWLLPMLMNGQVTVSDAKSSAKTIDLNAEVEHYQQRKILANYILSQSAIDLSLGKVKFEKLLHLSEYHIVKEQLYQQYGQHAAGPLDAAFTYRFFKEAASEGIISFKKQGALQQIVVNKKALAGIGTQFSEEIRSQIDALIQRFMGSNYEKPEIISTLYAVWNNRIIKNELITDELLKQDFLAWDTQKAKYKDQLDKNLAWMRKEGIVPDGWGEVIEGS
jgi:type I restriction enzyme S subunit